MAEEDFADNPAYSELPLAMQDLLASLPWATGEGHVDDDFASYHEVGFVLDDGALVQAAVTYGKWIPLPTEIASRITHVAYVLDPEGRRWSAGPPPEASIWDVLGFRAYGGPPC